MMERREHCLHWRSIMVRGAGCLQQRSYGGAEGMTRAVGFWQLGMVAARQTAGKLHSSTRSSDALHWLVQLVSPAVAVPLHIARSEGR